MLYRRVVVVIEVFTILSDFCVYLNVTSPICVRVCLSVCLSRLTLVTGKTVYENLILLMRKKVVSKNIFCLITSGRGL